MNPSVNPLRVASRMIVRLRSRAAWIVATYAVFATVWIVLSHWILGRLATSQEQLARWSLYRGLVFVVISSALLLVLIRFAFGAMEKAYALLRAKQAEIRRLDRLNAALSHINQAITRMPVRTELFSRICQVLVQHGGFRLAWIGWHNPTTRQLEPVAVAGDESDYVRNLKVYTDDDRSEDRGPAGRSFRDNRPCVCNDVLADPIMLPWRAELQRRGFHACVSLPVRSGEQTGGVLVVYADEPDFFQDKEMILLTEATADLAFALDNLARAEEQRRAEARAQSEQMFSNTMIESMPGAVYFYDTGGRFLRWNRNFETVTGYSAEEIARMHPRDFFAPADQPVLEQRIAEVFARGESWLEAPFRAKDGHTTLYYFTGRRVMFEGMTCLVGVGIDISERKQAEDRLAESERKYRELVESANSIILRWNSEGRITLLNEFGQRFFGYSADEILGRHVIGTIVPITESSGRDLQRLMDQICAEPTAFERNVNENIRRNGQRVWISWTNRVVWDDQGRVREVLSIGTDITDQRKAEMALRVLNETLELEVAGRTAELKTALARAEEADQIKSAFLATMSHELRTPLNSIIGFTGILLQELAGPLNAEQNKQLGMVRGSARHLLELINDVLDISKIEAGQLEVHAEPFDLSASIERVTTSVKPLAEKKGLELATVLPAELPQMTSDRRRVEQILLNLVNNAIKFTDHGRVTITIETVAAFQLSLEGPKFPAVRMRVTDTGIGIKPANLALLFQPFRQLDTGLTRKHDGTGLGLAICRRLAGLLGGEISADSVWQQGSEFVVVLPLEIQPRV